MKLGPRAEEGEQAAGCARSMDMNISARSNQGGRGRNGGECGSRLNARRKRAHDAPE